jgi:hypothetical protein
MISAVITADIVASTSLSRIQLKILMKNLSMILAPYQHEFFRGDSFQVYIKSPGEALLLLLQMRTAAMKLAQDSSMPLTDVRACLGIGAVKPPVKTLKTASDEAFVLSGRAFDKMSAEQRLGITGNEKNIEVNLGLKLIAGFIDYVFQRLTSKQAAVVFELLMGRTQVEAARRLKKSQATVHKHARSAGWPEIEKLLPDYQTLISLLVL